MIFLEGGMSGLWVLVLLMLAGPALVLGLIGFLFRRKNKKVATVFYILAILYFIIGWGVCSGM
ncbi:LPXTG cell wall anchor domain-containing protein [Tenacibaculum jejuense]|uniref:Uncharacterized protein n=1 Tax=Tenacibaculum jejuense TaxID=584609 RepID=A0A238U536_9FLAO|nr:LPXTG cell wall anchor domain-containing protein [Tenacibaculum jejuense]SNR14319.1 conserved protein of unknown function [Tenacibaculum jejuense]